VRTEIARLLGWPENKVRIKVPFLGSGYGSKLYIKLEALALALSMISEPPPQSKGGITSCLCEPG
jgi:CO/xanthine dehydrogenase Mo-binding subunit